MLKSKLFPSLQNIINYYRKVNYLVTKTHQLTNFFIQSTKKNDISNYVPLNSKRANFSFLHFKTLKRFTFTRNDILFSYPVPFLITLNQIIINNTTKVFVAISVAVGLNSTAAKVILVWNSFKLLGKFNAQLRYGRTEPGSEISWNSGGFTKGGRFYTKLVRLWTCARWGRVTSRGMLMWFTKVPL